MAVLRRRENVYGLRDDRLACTLFHLDLASLSVNYPTFWTLGGHFWLSNPWSCLLAMKGHGVAHRYMSPGSQILFLNRARIQHVQWQTVYPWSISNPTNLLLYKNSENTTPLLETTSPQTWHSVKFGMGYGLMNWNRILNETQWNVLISHWNQTVLYWPFTDIMTESNWQFVNSCTHCCRDMCKSTL